MLNIQFISLLIFAYLLGSIPAAYLAAKWSQGIDVRRYGSGNVGVSNLMKVAPRRLTILVTVFDAGKGVATVLTARMLGLDTAQQIFVGLATVVGHNWSVFLHFSAGRGALTTLGVVLASAPRLALVLLLLGLLGIPFGLMPLTALLAAAVLPVLSWFSSAPIVNWFFEGPLETGSQLPVTLGFLAIFLVLVTRRLTAPRTSLTSTISVKELLMNRLFLDRDIKDRKAWVHRKPIEDSGRKEEVKKGSSER